MALYTTPAGGQVCLMTACLISSVIFPFTINKNAIIFYSEFLAEESQEKFWNFVEANQNIENDHDGNIWYKSHLLLLLLLLTHANACQPVCLFVMKPLRSYIWYLSNVTCARVLLYWIFILKYCMLLCSCLLYQTLKG